MSFDISVMGNIDQINEFMIQRHIQWEINPPSASHFGGVWERLIRSVRKVLYSVMHEQNIHLSDEGLVTLFCEVESILNGRPITEMSNDISDLNVLTPNSTISPTFMFLFCFVHFCRACRIGKYSFRHLDQNKSARY
jgi:hypothetical protein